MRARMDPLTPLPDQMMALAREALEAGLRIQAGPALRGRYWLIVDLPDRRSRFHEWQVGPDGVWSQIRGGDRVRLTRSMLAHLKGLREEAS